MSIGSEARALCKDPLEAGETPLLKLVRKDVELIRGRVLEAAPAGCWHTAIYDEDLFCYLLRKTSHRRLLIRELQAEALVVAVKGQGTHEVRLDIRWP